MYRRNLTISLGASDARGLDRWPAFGENKIAANITTAGFEFSVEDEVTAARCAYINDLLMDPENGV